jgi:cyclic-di-AMP phosphodiesterase PgpH
MPSSTTERADRAGMDRRGERAQVARRRDSIIRARPRAGQVHRILLALAFALLGTPIVTAGSWVADLAGARLDEPAPVTIRTPLFVGPSADRPRGGGIAAERGQVAPDAAELERARAGQPSGWGAAAAYMAALFVVGLLYTERLRRSHKGRLLRTQAALLGLLLGLAAAAQAALLFTPLAAVALPSAFLALCAAVAIDLGAALATAVVGALLLGGLTPFDPGVMTVLVVQGTCAALFLGERSHGRRVPRRRLLAAGAVGGAAAALVYFLIHYLSWGRAPPLELDAPLTSAWLAAGVAGLVAALLAIPLLAGFQRLIGDISLGALIELEDLSNPLLVQIAESSPGTWQHSLAMANMAHIAANAIGADGRLVRVGAYYHDLGKSLQPKYFIENLAGGEASPHDALPPPISCDAIFAHVTEGVRVARRHGLHERVIDFMHMHHGDGLLEYFWVKCQEQGNPERLSEEDFRYPGVKPDSRETAILAICDAVEAASRTLRTPDAQAIEGLVQRIVYGKLHLGQLDDSGLTVADLRVISNSLMETIKHAHHGRIQYQWQRPRGASAEGEAAPDEGRAAASEPEVEPASPTQRLLREPRLDSLDAPRPAWRAREPGAGSRMLETAATEPISSDAMATVSLTRPPTAAEVARATSPPFRSPAGSGSAPAAPSDSRPVESSPAPGDSSSNGAHGRADEPEAGQPADERADRAEDTPRSDDAQRS